MYQENKEEEELPALKTVLNSIQWLKDCIEKQEGGLIEPIKNDTVNSMDNNDNN